MSNLVEHEPVMDGGTQEDELPAGPMSDLEKLGLYSIVSFLRYPRQDSTQENDIQ